MKYFLPFLAGVICLVLAFTSKGDDQNQFILIGALFFYVARFRILEAKP